MENLKQTYKTILEVILDRQPVVGVSDEDISIALGFTKPAQFEMIKKKASKFNIGHIEALANILSMDPVYLLRIHLIETSPTTMSVLDRFMCTQLLTSNEMKLVESYRYLAKGNDVTPVVLDSNNFVALLSI